MSEETQGVGEALRVGREARGLSVEAAAEALHLSNSTVRRLENEDWEGLQAPVYVRGYIASYARLLGLDEAALLSLYKVVDVRSGDDSPRIELTSVDDGQKGVRTSWIFAGAALAVAVVVAIVLLLVLPESEEGMVQDDVAEAGEVAQAAAQEVAQTAAQEGDAAPTVPAVQEASESAAAEGEPAAAATQEAPPVPPVQDGAAAVAEQAEETAGEGLMPQFGADQPAPADALEAPPVGEGGAVRLTALGDDEIELTFSDKCWVEVKDLNGNYLHAALGEADETLLLVGQGPFDIKLGYVPGVALTFNGTPVPLAAHTRDSVASLVLGR